MSDILYVLKTSDHFYKVGIATDLYIRIAQLQTGCPTPIDMARSFQVNNAKLAESLSHNALRQYALRGEWFEVPDDHVNEFISSIEHLVESVNSGSLTDDDTGDTQILRNARATIEQSGLRERTRQAYVYWITKFIKEQHILTESDLHADVIKNFIQQLQITKAYSPTSVSQAFHALIYLFEKVSSINVPRELNSILERRPKPSFHILPRSEIIRLIDGTPSTLKAQVMLLYGCGLRLMECLCIRVLDVNLEAMLLYIRNSEGVVSRQVSIPETMLPLLRLKLKERENLHKSDLLKGDGYIITPRATTGNDKEISNALEWQFIFSSQKQTNTPNGAYSIRLHQDPKNIQRSIKATAKKLGIDVRITSQSLRHSFAVHMLEKGYSLKNLQECLGHSDISQTSAYLPYIIKSNETIKSPLDWDYT